MKEGERNDPQTVKNVFCLKAPLSTLFRGISSVHTMVIPCASGFLLIEQSLHCTCEWAMGVKIQDKTFGNVMLHTDGGRKDQVGDCLKR